MNKDYMHKIEFIKEMFLKHPEKYIGCYFENIVEKISFTEFCDNAKIILPNDLAILWENYAGCRLGWCKFISLDKVDSPLSFYIETLKGFDFYNNEIPFAEDSVGDFYCVDLNGKIILNSVENMFCEPILVANSFEEFINECVFGKRYAEFADTENDVFYNFLIQHNLLTS